MKRFQGSRFWKIGFFLLASCLILASGGYWYINRPQFYAFVQSKIKNELGIDVKWRSLHWSIWGWLKVVEPNLDRIQESVHLHGNADSMELNHLFSGKPDVDIHQAVLMSGTATIASVSQVFMQWSRESSFPRARVSLNDVAIDPIPLMTFNPSPNGKPTSVSPDLRWLDSVTFSNTRIHATPLMTKYRWDGTIRMHESESSAIVHLWMAPEKFKGTRRDDRSVSAELRAIVLPAEKQMYSMDLAMSRFPVEVTGDISVSSIVDGTMNAESLTTGEMRIHSNWIFSNLNVRLPQSETGTIPHLAVSSDILTSSRFLPLEATAVIEHSSFPFRSALSTEYSIPQGKMILQYTPEKNGYKGLSINGQIPSMGNYSLQIDEFPLSATSSWVAEIHSENQVLSRLLKEITSISFPGMTSVDGNVSVSAKAKGRGMHFDEFSAQALLRKGKLKIGKNQIEGASARISVFRKDGIVRVDGFGEAIARFTLSGTQPIILTPRIHTRGQWEQEKNEFSFLIPQADLGVIQSVTGWFRSGKGWRLEGIIPLEESVKSLRDGFPVWAQTLEGAGESRFLLEGNDRVIHTQISSPDWMLYSLSDAYSYGIQLRNMKFEGRYDLQKGGSVSAELKASTPYITYGVSEWEWPGKSFRLSLESHDFRKIIGSLHPPGGGEIRLEGDPFQSMKIKSKDINLETFLLSIIDRFAWGNEENGKALYEAEGVVNSVLDVNRKDTDFRITGDSQLLLNSFRLPRGASFTIQGASIHIPIVFPLAYPGFSTKAVSVSAERVLWDGANFSHFAFTIPLNSQNLLLAKDVTVPLFGGLIQIRNLEWKNWLSSGVELVGSIQLNQLQLSRIASILPIVPAQGTLSGEIRRILYDGERIEFQGRLVFNLFGGNVVVHDTFMRNAYAGAKMIGFSAELERIDVTQLASYFQWGYMTGILSGKMNNIQLILPPGDSKDWMMPNLVDIELSSDPKQEGIISKETLVKILELSGKSDVDLSKVNVSQFRYSQIGLRILLDGIQMRLIGTLKDNYFLTPSKNLFVNKIGIRLGVSDRPLDFVDFWSKLLFLSGRSPKQSE